MARLCFILLAHEGPDRVAGLARLLATAGSDSRVVIHYDANATDANFAELKSRLADEPRVACLEDRVRCGWGKFSLVEATLRGLRAIRKAGPMPDRVLLVSGACMPNRPIAELERFSEAWRDTDFIEINHSDWIVGGMRDDRYRYHHVLNQRRWPKLFKWFYYAQKYLGPKRSFPKGLEPRFGSQWWALTGSTCAAILDYLDNNPKVLSFFRTTWIPDELFFQTLVHKLVPADRIISRSLTFYYFNGWGMPVVFLDDHAELAAGLPHFFVRKLSPRANRLREALSEIARAPAPDRPLFDPRLPVRFGYRDWTAEALAVPDGHTRLFSKLNPQSPDLAMGDYAKPFVVLYGPPALTGPAARRLNAAPGFGALGRVFDRSAADFGPAAGLYNILRANETRLRDAFPASFLKMALARTTGIPVIEISPRDNPAFTKSLAQSSHAIFLPVVPRQPARIWSDLWWLLCAKPAESAEMSYATGAHEYVQRLINDQDIDPVLAEHTNRLLAEPLPEDWRGHVDADNLYRHGEAVRPVATALPFLHAAMSGLDLDALLADYPEAVRKTFVTQAAGRPVFTFRLGFTLPDDDGAIAGRKAFLQLLKHRL